MSASVTPTLTALPYRTSRWSPPTGARALFLASLLLSVYASIVFATQYPPVGLRLEMDPNDLPLPGEVFRATLQWETSVPIDLVSAELRSGRREDGRLHWETLVFDPPVEQPLVPGVPFRVDLELLCEDQTQPFFVEYQIGGFHVSKTFYVLPRMTGQSERIVDPAARPWVSVAGDLARPDPVAPPPVSYTERDSRRGTHESESLEDTEADEAPLTSGGTLRTAFGDIRYFRPDGRFGRADGVSVRLYDDDFGSDDFLGSAVTDAEGHFVIEYLWLEEGDPDLYVEYEAANSRINVKYPASFGPTYAWTSATIADASGSSVDFHQLQPEPEIDRAVLHTLSQLTRLWRFLYWAGYDNPLQCDVSMPDSDWPYYSPYYDEIYIPMDWIWEDRMYWHEFGHHWVSGFIPPSQGTDYCNDRCDEPNDCGHCLWCQETAADAWSEGFPDWLSDRMAREIDAVYESFAGPALSSYDFEVNLGCASSFGGNDTYDDPSRTEGIFAALLRDLEDGGVPDADPLAQGIGLDRTAFGAASVISTAQMYQTTTPWEFLNAFRDRYPSSLSDIWSTAFNNGYNLDQGNPGAVTNLTSPSHLPNSPSPDATIEYTWTPAPDDIAGIGGYSVWIGPSPTLPDATADIGAESSLITGELAPGTFWFSIRAMDKVGHWSASYATYGPIIIREPNPANLVTHAGPNFDAPFVPTNIPIPFSGQAHAPPLLQHDATTYGHLSVYNGGDLPTSGPFQSRVWVDGDPAYVAIFPSTEPVPALSYVYKHNLGPIQVRGGRHTFATWVDATEDIAEPVEVDNKHSKQWVFVPYTVARSPIESEPPPLPFRGWLGGVPMFASPNCVGFRFDAGTEVYSGVSMLPLGTGDDYDIRSHAPSLTAEGGFEYGSAYAFSARDTSCVEAVFVNPETAFGEEWDVSVVNANPNDRASHEWQNFLIRRVDSVLLPLSQTVHEEWFENEALALFHFLAPNRTPLLRTVEVIADPSAGPLHFGVYELDIDHASLLDHIVAGETDETGHGTLAFTSVEGAWAISVWRDPRDAPGGGLPLAPTSFSIRVLPQRPDLEPAHLAGWAAPLVPRPAGDGTPTTVPMPLFLSGDAPATWLNAAFANTTVNAATQVVSEELLDGVPIASQLWPSVAGYSTKTWNAPTPTTVRAGRHTLSLHLDPSATIAEEDEGDNVFAAQWSWTPVTLTPNQMVQRDAPPEPTAGWSDVLASGGSIASYNCDGVRLPLPPSGEDGQWLAFASMPGTSSDVDLRLHDATQNAITGFATPLVASVFGPAQSDYVLANFRATSPRNFDVGVVGQEGSQPYTGSAVSSNYLDAPFGSHGPFTLTSGRIVALHEVFLTAGGVGVELIDVSGTVDWGLSIHRAGLPFQSKSTPMQNGQAWTEGGPGEDEHATIVVPEDGHYCIAVWKAYSSDLADVGSYQLVIQPDATEVPDAPEPSQPPSGSGISASTPNPFSPSSEIQYQIASTSAVALELFDLQGRLVRTLVSEILPVGRYEAQWDGRDSMGRTAGNGIYFARLAVDGVRTQRKLLLLR